MLDEIRALLILQNRDRRLLAIGKDLEKLPQEEARAKAKLSDDKVAVAKAHDELRACELRVKKIELDAETRRTTIKRLKQQQFETRKNDEFQALAHEVARYEKELDGMETLELEAMEEIDSFRSALTQAEAALAKTATLIQEDLDQLDQRRTRLKEDLAEVSAERDQLVTQVPDSVLPLYSRLMKSKNGLAIAPLKDGKCEGCHMKLIPSTVVKVQTGKELTQCEDCGRILYWED